MARLKLKQVLSNLHYNEADDQLILSGSKVPDGNLIWNEASQSWEDAWGDWDGGRSSIPDFVMRGTMLVTASIYDQGTLSIAGLDTFGDTGSFDTIDLGEYWYLLV